jgi:ureidoacrylate peracid hydrolase
MSQPTSREIEIDPQHTTLLFVDVQKYNCTWEGGEYTHLSAAEREARYGYFFRSLDYKITGFNVPKGSPDARMVDELAPADDEMVFPKTSSSVFISTNIDYVLRNLETRYLIIAGCLTDQCVDSAVRDACDLGYLVTVPTDATLTLSPERHDWSLKNNRGYCRQRTTRELVDEIARLTGT